MAIGATVGTIAGAALTGGNPIGAAVGGALGSGVDALIANKKAKGAFPDYEDPMLQNYLADIKNRQRSVDTGAMAGTLRQGYERGISRITEGIGESAGGSSIATNLQMLARNTGESFNQVIGKIEERSMQYDSLVGALIAKISDRKTQLGLARYSQAQADKYQAQKNMTGLVSQGMSDLAEYQGYDTGGKKWGGFDYDDDPLDSDVQKKEESYYGSGYEYERTA